MADPVSLTALALGGAGLGAALFASKDTPAAPGATVPAAPPTPTPDTSIQQPVGNPQGAKSAAAAGNSSGAPTPSFIGATALPTQGAYGAKSLLGQ